MAAATKASFEGPQGIDSDVKQAVLEQLERIREDKLFRDTTRMKRFLSYVVTEALAGNSALLKGYTIGLEVFDKPDDFDPQADTIVRVQAGQLRRRLDLYYGSTGLKDPVRLVIPKGQYAPVFEMRRNTSETNSSHTEQVDRSFTDALTDLDSQSRPSIAVVTFSDFSGPNKSDFFAEGLTAEIVNALVQFRYLRIVTRTPTVESSGETVDIKKFAEDYDVQFVLNGTVRHVGETLRVSVNLIATETGEHVFTRIFNKQYTADNIFDIQDKIASYTAAKVAAPLGVVNRYNRRANLGRCENMPAYEALLKYYEIKLSPTTEKVKDLLGEFEKITERQENFSSAWAVRSLLNTFLCTLAIPSEIGKGRLDAAIEFGTKASEIDPDNALAFMALFQAQYHSGHLELSEKMAQKSLSLNPNDYSMLAYYAITNAFRGNTDRALCCRNAALRLIECPPAWFYLSELVLAFQDRRFQDVREIFEGVEAENAGGSHFLTLATLGHLGDIGAAHDLLDSLSLKDKNFTEGAVETFLSWQPNEKLRAIAFDGWRLLGLTI